MTSSVRGVIAAVQLALLSSLLLVAGIVALRRLTGGPSVPLTATMLVATGAAFAAASLVGRLAGAGWQGPSTPSWLQWAAALIPLASCGLLVAGLLLPGTSLVGACLLVALLAVEETWSLARPPLRAGVVRYGVGSQFRGPGSRTLYNVRQATKLTPDPLAESPLAEIADEIDQQFTRRRGFQGEEVFEGFVRVQFAAGQRTAEAHVAFCPPFEHRPRVVYEAVSGPAARIELGQVLPLGARLDVKLTQAAGQETSLMVRFTATADGHVADSVISPLCA